MNIQAFKMCMSYDNNKTKLLMKQNKIAFVIS